MDNAFIVVLVEFEVQRYIIFIEGLKVLFREVESRDIESFNFVVGFGLRIIFVFIFDFSFEIVILLLQVKRVSLNDCCYSLFVIYLWFFFIFISLLFLDIFL